MPPTTRHLYVRSIRLLHLTPARHVPNPADPAVRLAALVDEYREHDNLGALFDGLRALARDTIPPTP